MMKKMMIDPENKQMLIYLAIAFIGGWACMFIGMFSGSQTVYTALLSLAMYMPLLGVFVISHFRLGQKDTGIFWKVQFKKNWKYILLAWFMPAVFTLLGAVLYFAVFPNRFDSSLGYLTSYYELLAQNGTLTGTVDVKSAMTMEIVSALTFAPLINMIYALGEEVGWRGYMTVKFKARLGRTKGLITSGFLWGVWHWPLIILAGYEYGIGYQGYPFTGMIMMCVFTTAVGILLSYLYEKSNCIWICALAHGALNAIAALPLYYLYSIPTHYLMGPLLPGAVSVIPMAITAAYILFKKEKTSEPVMKQGETQ